jgi:hypothetical protein
MIIVSTIVSLILIALVLSVTLLFTTEPAAPTGRPAVVGRHRIGVAAGTEAQRALWGLA